MKNFEQEIKKGTRFEFGKNWLAFLSTLNDERINEAKRSICELLEVTDLNGKRFLDIGSGSGLFSLAACALGAHVHSFDYDPVSVACTKELKSRYFPERNRWIVKQGSVLDKNFMASLGKYDIVYSWGVLHHTGNMWQALENIISLVEEKGFLFIAIYNDCGLRSKIWLRIKKLYCSGVIGKTLVFGFFIPYYFLKNCVKAAIVRKNVFSEYKRKRGMSIVHDWYDWLGGLPYEFAKVEDIFNFYKYRGFKLKNIRTTYSTANNQFVFIKEYPSQADEKN